MQKLTAEGAPGRDNNMKISISRSSYQVTGRLRVTLYLQQLTVVFNPAIMHLTNGNTNTIIVWRLLQNVSEYSISEFHLRDKITIIFRGQRIYENS